MGRGWNRIQVRPAMSGIGIMSTWCSHQRKSLSPVPMPQGPSSVFPLNWGTIGVGSLLILSEILRSGLVHGLPCGSDSKESACSAGVPGSVPGSGRSPGEGNGNPLQYSCLENPLDREAWWVTVYGVTKSRTRLSE